MCCGSVFLFLLVIPVLNKIGGKLPNLGNFCSSCQDLKTSSWGSWREIVSHAVNTCVHKEKKVILRCHFYLLN